MAMGDYFVPYSGKRPASLVINGHKLVILSQERNSIEEELDLLGADRVKVIKVGRSKTAQEKALEKIAKQVDGGIVIAPHDVEIKEVIKSLESGLPWLQ